MLGSPPRSGYNSVSPQLATTGNPPQSLTHLSSWAQLWSSRKFLERAVQSSVVMSHLLHQAPNCLPWGRSFGTLPFVHSPQEESLNGAARNLDPWVEVTGSLQAQAWESPPHRPDLWMRINKLKSGEHVERKAHWEFFPSWALDYKMLSPPLFLQLWNSSFISICN